MLVSVVVVACAILVWRCTILLLSFCQLGYAEATCMAPVRVSGDSAYVALRVSTMLVSASDQAEQCDAQYTRDVHALKWHT